MTSKSLPLEFHYTSLTAEHVYMDVLSLSEMQHAHN